MKAPGYIPLHPVFEQQMHDQLGNSFQQFVDSLTEEPPVSIHLHPHKKHDFMTGYSLTPVAWSSYGMYLDARPKFTLDPSFHAGAYYVQEASSMSIEAAVRQAIDSIHQPKVLDLCASPGGKSTLLLSILNGRGLLVSNETIQSRLSSLEHNLTKWGYSNQIITSVDPDRLKELPDYFDLILVDAPCSGEGLFRKDPSSRLEWTPDKAHQCVLRQQRILNHAMSALKPGGHLIYSTCTFNPAENIQQVQYMSSYGMSSQIIAELEKSGLTKIELGANAGYQIYPHIDRGEGFFLASLQKESGEGQHGFTRRPLDWCPIPDDARTYLKSEEYRCFIHKEIYHLIDPTMEEALEYLSNKLRIVRAGIPLGHFRPGHFAPDHGLSQSIVLADHIPSIALDLNQSISYLKKNSIPNETAQRGYHLVTYQGLGLGWCKAVPNRLNNLYPQAYRILGHFD